MPSNSKPSPTQDSSPTSEDTKTLEKDRACTICKWLTKLQNGTQKEMLKHMAKFHPPE